MVCGEAAFEKGAAVGLHYVGGMPLQRSVVDPASYPVFFMHCEYDIDLLDDQCTFLTNGALPRDLSNITEEPNEEDVVPLI